MAQEQVSPWTINSAIAALRFFFTVTLERPDLVRPLRLVPNAGGAEPGGGGASPRTAPSLKYKAALSVAYGAGLRVSEVANLKESDIDRERMTLRVEQGKGQRDRTVMLSPRLLRLLREWWKAARPQVWLFPGQNPINPVTPRQLNRAVTAVTTAKILAGITKRVSPHTLRHRFASKQTHTARNHPIEGRIYYPFHPRCGETVLILRQYAYRGIDLVVIPQPDGAVACIPAWMTHESRFDSDICSKRGPVQAKQACHLETDAQAPEGVCLRS
jgi:integrase